LDFLGNHIEALIFCSEKPIKTSDLQHCLSEMFEAEVPEKDITDAIALVQAKYEDEQYPFQVVKSGGGYQFLTKPAYQTSISILLKQQSKKRLSTSALETLSIIAYKQPVTKSEMEQIRGVNCDYSVQKLLDKELVEIKGKSDSIGRPLLYGTSEKFMDYFGINDLKDLPTPKDFATDENKIGDEHEGAPPEIKPASPTE
jgi:segregation and condensation protein B